MTSSSRVGETTVKTPIVEETKILLKLAPQFMDAQSHLGRTAYVSGCFICREPWGEVDVCMQRISKE